ncbi:MFS transporter [Helicobacter sp. 23-1044]
MFKITASLSIIAALRFFGLFVVMPTLALFVQDFGVNSASVIGIAISAYAVSQIIFQVPFGILGDKFQKRAVITFGLLIFAVGSIICAFATSIEMLIFGRILQGAGAIGSVISANITDLISEEKRGGAMAFMGVCIFISFIVAMILGSALGARYGTDKLFLLTAFLSLIAIIPLWVLVPKSPNLRYSTPKSNHFALLCDKNLALLNVSIAVQKFLMSFAFVIIPVMLISHFGMDKNDIWKVFSLSAVLGLFALPPSMIIAEKKKLPKEVLLFSIALFGVAFALIGIGDGGKSLFTYAVGVVAFFCAFCISEPILQNLASKYPKIQDKSVSLGIFTTFGYLGSFLGGVLGGFIIDKFNFVLVIWVVIIAIALWFVAFLALKNPKNSQNLYVKISSQIKSIAEINAMQGVLESYVNENENLLIVKFDNTIIKKEALEGAILR